MSSTKGQVVRINANYKVASAYEEKFTINYAGEYIMLNAGRTITFKELLKYLPAAIERNRPADEQPTSKDIEAVPKSKSKGTKGK